MTCLVDIILSGAWINLHSSMLGTFFEYTLALFFRKKYLRRFLEKMHKLFISVLNESTLFDLLFCQPPEIGPSSMIFRLGTHFNEYSTLMDQSPWLNSLTFSILAEYCIRHKKYNNVLQKLIWILWILKNFIRSGIKYAEIS